MNTLAVVGLMVGVVVGLRLLVRRLRQARRSTLQSIATELGLRVAERDALGTSLPTSSSGVGHGQDRPLADVATAAWGPQVELHGTWNGRQIGINAVPRPRYRMALGAHCALPADLRLFASANRATHGDPPEALTRTPTGDATFDERVVVWAKRVTEAQILLQRPALRQVLLDTVGKNPLARVYLNWVYVVPYDNAVPDAATARGHLDDVSRMAEAIDRALAE